MKDKLKEILEEYQNDAKRLWGLTKYKVRGLYKDKLKGILEDYQNDAKRLWGLTKYKARGLYKKFKESLDNPKNRLRYLVMASSFIIVLLLANLYNSYGYYNDVASFSILGAKVGNLYVKDSDYVLLVYLENSNTSGEGNGDYRLGSNIPTFGYEYSGYKCKNNSQLIYDPDLKTTSVNLVQKDVCSIYFDLKVALDLTINVMLEDSPLSDTYTLSKYVPPYGYVYSHFECQNGGTIEYDANLHKAILTSQGKDYCNIYFNREKADITVNLYVENTYNTQDYIERVSIPSNVSYHLNSESYCVNMANERIADALDYQDGYIITTTNEIASCKVYLDRDE